MAAAYACNQQAAASASMAHGARARPCRLGVVAQVRAMLTPKAADEQQPIVVGCSTDNWNTDSWNTDSSLGLLERLEPPRAAGLPAACTRRDVVGAPFRAPCGVQSTARRWCSAPPQAIGDSRAVV